jgi:hypothetical protein
MKLSVVRRWLSKKSSIGEFYVDGERECFTLEDKTRGPDEPKVFGETAIPVGTYPVTLERSPRFSKMLGHDVYLPRLHNVPGFEGVLIHTGNKPEDTEGCILLGESRAADGVLESRAAFARFIPKLEAALNRGESITITVEVQPE